MIETRAQFACLVCQTPLREHEERDNEIGRVLVIKWEQKHSLCRERVYYHGEKAVAANFL